MNHIKLAEAISTMQYIKLNNPYIMQQRPHFKWNFIEKLYIFIIIIKHIRDFIIAHFN